MATIYNSELTKELIKGAKIQTSIDKVPNQIAEKVVPVMEVNPRLTKTASIVKAQSATNAASATIYTTPSNQDFYLTSVFISVIKDATSTSTNSNVRAYINGVDTPILRIVGLTLTAQNAQNSLSFDFPIKIDRNTSIVLENSTAVANITSYGGITGYIDEASNA